MLWFTDSFSSFSVTILKQKTIIFQKEIACRGPKDNVMVSSEIPPRCCRGNKNRLNRTAFQVQNAEGQKSTKA